MIAAFFFRASIFAEELLDGNLQKVFHDFPPTPKSFTTLQEKKAKQIKSSQTSSSLSGLTTSSPSLCSDFRGFMGLTLWLDAWRFAANRTKLFFYSKLSNLAWLPYTHAMKWPKHGLPSNSDSQSFSHQDFYLPWTAGLRLSTAQITAVNCSKSARAKAILLDEPWKPDEIGNGHKWTWFICCWEWLTAMDCSRVIRASTYGSV